MHTSTSQPINHKQCASFIFRLFASSNFKIWLHKMLQLSLLFGGPVLIGRCWFFLHFRLHSHGKRATLVVCIERVFPSVCIFVCFTLRPRIHTQVSAYICCVCVCVHLRCLLRSLIVLFALFSDSGLGVFLPFFLYNFTVSLVRRSLPYLYT